MEIIRNNLKETIKLPKNYQFFYDNMNFVIFDIETTGLNSNFNEIILIGLLFIENNEIIIEQLFCNNRKEEAQLLTTFMEKINKFDLLINYNGNSFDIPFLNRRFSKNEINYSIENHKSLDLLKLIRKAKHRFQLDNFKLKSVERYLGIHRNDTISGGDSVELYNEYEGTQQKKLKDIILLHNYDDLYYLGKSLKIINEISLEEIMLCCPSIIPIADGQLAYVTKQVIKGSTLNLEGFYKRKSDNHYIAFEKGFNFEYIGETNIFKIAIPLYKGQLASGTKCLYIDINDFPFSYENQNEKVNVPNHVLLLKEGTTVHSKKIYFFAHNLIKYLFHE